MRSAEENERGYLMNKTHLRPIADASAGGAVELSLTSGCFMLSVVQPHLKAYQQIVRYFGTDILLESGEINREALGSIIFSQPEKRQLLNAITHPEIQKEMLKQVLKYFVLGKRCRPSLLALASAFKWGEGWGRRREPALSDGLCVCHLEDSFLPSLPFIAALHVLLLWCKVHLEGLRKAL